MIQVEKTFLVLMALLLLPSLTKAQEYIIVQKNDKIKVESAKKIHVYNMKGINIKVKGSSTTEVGYSVKIRANENAIMKNFGGGRVYSQLKDDVLEIYFKTTDSDENNSNKNNITWIKSLFSSNDEKSINEVKEAILELEIPENLDLKLTARYSNLDINSLNGNLSISNKSGDVSVKSIGKSVDISNDYGKVSVDKVLGNVTIESRSNESQITDIEGSVKINSNYSTIRAERIKGSLTTENRSGTVRVEDVSSDFTHTGDYTNLKVKRVKGTVNITNKSGSLDFEDIGSLQMRGAYSNIDGSNITSNRLVNIESKSSTIKLKKLAGSLTIDGSYLKISVEDVADNIKIYNKSGSTDVISAKGPIRIDGDYNEINLEKISSSSIDINNSSADIRVEILNAPENIRIRNRHGNASVFLNPTSIGKGTLEVSNGKITSNFNKDFIARDVNMDVSRVVELKGNGITQIDIRVESGNVNIN